MKPFYGLVDNKDVLCLHVEDGHLLCADDKGKILYYPIYKITFNRLVDGGEEKK